MSQQNISELLTIVIPTRNRLEYLEIALRSIFELQDAIPNVIVSDNSTSDLPGMEALRSRYPFSYVRQSGKLSMLDHHNACLRLVPTEWVLLLHDDDEIYPDVLGKLGSALANCNDAGLLVGGIQYINEHGEPRGSWIPDFGGAFKGEDIVLRLGLDYRISPPGTVWRVAILHDVGGLPDANGTGAEQTLVLRLAYSYGIVVLPELVGRYRIWPDQATNFGEPERAEYVLECTIQGAQLIRTIGISSAAADQLVDYMVWWVFRYITPLFSKHPFFVSRLCRRCELASPPDGVWKNRVRSEHPYLFWKPRRLSILCSLVAMTFFPRPVRRHLYGLLRR